MNFLIAPLVMFQGAFVKLKLFVRHEMPSLAERHPGYAWVGQSSQEPVLGYLYFSCIIVVHRI